MSFNLSISNNVPKFNQVEGSFCGTIDLLPVEVLSLVLAKLPPIEDIKNASVCRLWYEWIKTLPDEALPVFGKKEWKDVLNYEAGEEPLKPHFIRCLHARMAEKLEGLGTSLILIPQGLNLNILSETLNRIETGQSLKFAKWSHKDTLNDFGPISIEGSYWVLVTNGILLGTKGIAKEAALNHMTEQYGASFCIPSLIEASLSAIATFARSRENCFHNVYTYCSEKYKESYVLAGGICQQSIHVCVHYFPSVSFGAAMCRRF